MKQLAWVTDPHLNFATDEYRIASLGQEIVATGADAVLIGGDIGEATSFAEYLEALSAETALPIYFVLGNHDYCKGSIAGVREASRLLSRKSDMINWLPASGIVQITKETTLVGHGGWGDGRAGNFLESDVVLNDYLLIEELRDAHDFPETDTILTQRLLETVQILGDEAASHFRTVLHEAMQTSQNVVVLTHVPPFRESCWHEGHLSDDNWTPHFVCEAVGEVLANSMQQNPDKRMTVLCGHTHSSGQARILNNLEVMTGGANYGEPQVQETLEVM